MAFPILPVIGLGIQLLSSLLGGQAQNAATEKENQRQDYYNANMGQNINQYMKNYLLAPIGDPNMPTLGDPASLGMAPAQAQGSSGGGTKGGKPQVPGNPAGGGDMAMNAALPILAQLMMGAPNQGAQPTVQGQAGPGGLMGQLAPGGETDPALQMIMGLMGGGAMNPAMMMGQQAQQPVSPILQYMMGGGR
jgi:hypothetical protein